MSDGTFVYDDDCGFCTWLADYFAQRTDVELVGFAELEELSDEQRALLPEDHEECSHLLTEDGGVYSCGAAIEQGMALADVPPGADQVVEFLRQFRDYEEFREEAYEALAEQRGLLGQFVSKEQPSEG